MSGPVGASKQVLDGSMQEVSDQMDAYMAANMPAQTAYDAELLVGEDNLRKSMFWRSFLAKTPRSATMQVVRYNADGLIEPVPNMPLEERFIITSASMPQQENAQVLQTFGRDPDVLLTFGERPIVWSFDGILRNEQKKIFKVTYFLEDGTPSTLDAGDGDWRNAFVSSYNNNLRASQLVRKGQFLQFNLGDMVIYGYLLDIMVSERQENNMYTVFTIRMYVRKFITQEQLSIKAVTTKLDTIVPEYYAA